MRLSASAGSLLPSAPALRPSAARIEAPEFTRIEVVEVAGRAFEHIRHRQPLEMILLDVLKDRHVDGNLRSRPTLRLVDEAILELIETKAAEIGFGEVPDLMPLRRSFPCQQVGLIVAIEMHLVGRAAQVLAGFQLIDNVGVSSGRDEEVGNQSSPEKIPFSTLPAGTLP